MESNSIISFILLIIVVGINTACTLPSSKNNRDCVAKTIECRVLPAIQVEILDFTHKSIYFSCVDIDIIKSEEMRNLRTKIILQGAPVDKFVYREGELWKPIGTQCIVNALYGTKTQEFYLADTK
jgi:hypothetical protein